MLEHSETVEVVGFALHAERLAEAERHRQLREAERVSRTVRGPYQLRTAMAQSLLAVAAWLAPEVVPRAVTTG